MYARVAAVMAMVLAAVGAGFLGVGGRAGEAITALSPSRMSGIRPGGPSQMSDTRPGFFETARRALIGLKKDLDARAQAEPPVRPRTPHVQLTAQDRTALEFVGKMVKAGEARWERATVSYRRSVNVRTNISGQSPGAVVQSTDYLWASDGPRCRFDSTHRAPGETYLTSYVWNGREGRTYKRRLTARKVDRIAIELSGREAGLGDRRHFPEVALGCLGGQWLSTILRQYGTSAKHVAGAWEVRFANPDPGLPHGSCWARLRPDRGYSVDHLVRYVRPGVVYDDATVVRWIRGGGSEWIPAEIRHRLSGETVGAITSVVGSARLAAPPARLFTLPDDRRALVVDLRTNRVVREPAGRVVPVTEERLAATARYVGALPLRDREAEGERSTVLHDNGARGSSGGCGLECVWLLARLQRRGHPLEWLRRVHPGLDGTHSLLDLDKAARACGVSTVGLQVPPARVREIRQPFILYLEEMQHFCLVLRMDARCVYVYDPPGRVLRVPISPFMRVYGSGYVLALRGRGSGIGHEGE